MTPYQFQQKWRPSTLRERAASQEHFIDLCRLLGEPTPAEADPHGHFYTFDKKISRSRGGDGFADVWKRGHFGWEYKGKHRDLHAAFAQLRDYAPDLENPPLLVVSDMDLIRIHTNFTNAVQQIHEITLDDIVRPEKLTLLRQLFTNPKALRPGITREALTAEAANRFATLAKSLRDREFDPQRVAHFVTRLLFCLFAEDIGLLPEHLFTRLLEASRRDHTRFPIHASRLFDAMRTGGHFDLSDIEWFNGGLFDTGDALPLTIPDLDLLLECARLDWSAIEPSIMGTLFERGLDETKRAQLGAHYTDPGSIMRIVDPVVLRPLREQWDAVKNQIRAKLAGGNPKRAHTSARKLYEDYLANLRATRVLDPACGSGNFLYLALRGLKDLERQVMEEAAQLLGIPLGFPEVDPRNVLGIEINLYAAELARVTIWIGQIQWMLAHGFSLNRRPILQSLQQIECRDALLTETGAEASWPSATCIVGNPPFLGDKKILSTLGDDYVKHLRRTFNGRVPGGADYVTYWFEKARWQIEQGHTTRAGLVATNSIRAGKSRSVLDRIQPPIRVFEAWSDEPWILDGAAVRVSIVCFGGDRTSARLNGTDVAQINSDLTAGLDLSRALPIAANRNWSFFGLCLAGKFKVESSLARQWLTLPNPHGRSNRDVLRPIWNGRDVIHGWNGLWVIDFGPCMTEVEASLYENPFEHIRHVVMPERLANRRKGRAQRWWLHGETRPGLRQKLGGLARYIATSETAKHRVFVWLPASVAPEHKLVIIPREDDTTFGILSSKYHVLWAVAQGNRLGVGNDPVYNTSACFETFPFPEGLTPNIPASDYAADPHAQAIAEAARELNTLRENWLNPPDLVRRVPEVVPGFPDRLLPIDDKATEVLKKRTLTNLYNQRPAWLQHAHQRLDAAVAAAYGWPPDLSDDEILARLLALNLARAIMKP